MITAIIWFLVCFQLHWFYLAGLFSLNYLPVSHELCCPESFWFSFPIHETNFLRLSQWWFEPVSVWSDSSFTFFLYCIHLKQVTRSSQYAREGVISGKWTSGVRGLWETHGPQLHNFLLIFMSYLWLRLTPASYNVYFILDSSVHTCTVKFSIFQEISILVDVKHQIYPSSSPPKKIQTPNIQVHYNFS